MKLRLVRVPSSGSELSMAKTGLEAISRLLVIPAFVYRHIPDLSDAEHEISCAR